MCGIIGFWKNTKLKQNDLSFGMRCMQGLNHRGPDDEGYWFSAKKGIFFGHKRLSIIDLNNRSKQPFVFNNLVLNFNGEIYNYREIRKDLERKGHTFNTNSDTEVLIHAWYEWGEQCLDSIDGMYAFSIYDGKRLWLITDPFCEKPLYIYQKDDFLIYSSEANILIKELNLKISLSDKDLFEFISLGFLKSHNTGYSNLVNMPKATIYKFESPSLKTKKVYWSLPDRITETGKIENFTRSEINIIKENLINSIKIRLRSDVSMGLFLSSGLDSNLIAAIAVKELKSNLLTLTMKYPDGKDESNFAGEVAKYLGLKNLVVNSTLDNSWKEAPKTLFNLYGDLNDNITSISFRQLSLFARKHIKVALCGMGGDELVYGYNKYHFFHKWRLLYSENEIMSFFFRIIKPNIFKKFFYGNRFMRFIQLKNGGVFPKKFIDFFLESNDSSVGFNSSNLFYESNIFDLNHTLQKNYIPSVERASMRESLEVRSPFLSKNIFKSISKIDQRKFFKFGQKKILKILLKEYLPEKLINKKKMGFVFPLKRYIQTVDSIPRAKKINQKISKDLLGYFWNNRFLNNFDKIVFRIIMLDSFLNKKQ